MSLESIPIGSPLGYFVNKTLVRLYRDDIEADQVSKRDVTNAVVIGSIFAILFVMFLLLILATFCWCRYYQLLLINNRLVIKAKGYRILEDEESGPLEKSSISADNATNQITQEIPILTGDSAKNDVINNSLTVDEKQVINDEGTNETPDPTPTRMSNNTIGYDVSQPSNGIYRLDSFSKTLQIQKLVAEQTGQTNINDKVIADSYSNNKLRIGMVVVVIKSLTRDQMSAIANNSNAVRRLPSDLAQVITSYTRAPANELEWYLQQGDLLRIVDFDAESRLAKGVLLSNYLEIENDTINIQPRTVGRDLPFTDERLLVKFFPIDYVTLESSLIRAINSLEN